jgi:hypothetical protein
MACDRRVTGVAWRSSKSAQTALIVNAVCISYLQEGLRIKSRAFQSLFEPLASSNIDTSPSFTRDRLQRQSRMDAEQSSHLLRAVAALDDGVWGRYLLPKLLANRTAAAFASSCR